MPETWVQMLTIVGANLVTTVTLFLWCRHEAGEDRKIVNEDRRAILQLIRDIREDTVTLFLWCRHEAGEDRKIVNEDRREILQLIRDIREDVEQHKRETDQKMYALLREGK